jgi:hypothetical protein
MKITTVKKLSEAFTGKICTILTNTVAKTNFHDTQFSDFFTGFVESVDDDGLFLKHSMTGCITFFAMEHIVAILEEQVITEEDPRYQQVMEEIKKPQQTPVVEQPNVAGIKVAGMPDKSSPFVDPEMLAMLSKQASTSKMVRKNQP